MTGETLYGKSISVISTLLPKNWNLAIAQAAATPNTVLTGTAIRATSSVKRMADSASLSPSEWTYIAQPRLSAWANTAASGIARNRPRNVNETPINNQRTQRDSVVAAAARQRMFSVRFIVVVPTMFLAFSPGVHAAVPAAAKLTTPRTDGSTTARY